ncbi:hypothetical protein HKO22_08305 [Peptoniphilus sp. AGMB00490]|uniref:2-methylcitrate dehydratase n=1 Tax=Peptoniphilus faecalis TaxID=2731255 RepID=A0A848RKN8_9FIRM|nr:MmgE/PrpD family protein [Peptoniphilus faecalis]NMW85736.1 hypothetical protein [Peptoniphilus faecalis]
MTKKIHISELLDNLGNFLEDTNLDSIPDEIIERAKLTIADTLAVIFRGSEEREIQKLHKNLDSIEESFILSKDFKMTSAEKAAFVNITQSTFIELDEGTITGHHPAIHILPPILSYAQKHSKSGRDILLSFILGYEIYARFSEGIKLRDGFYPHGNIGHIASSIAIGKMEDWNKEKFINAILMSSSLQLATSYEASKVGATISTVFASFSAPISFLIKDLVDSGFYGFKNSLNDMYENLIGNEIDYEKIINNIGKEFKILDTYFKFHANCGVCHPAIEAAIDALEYTLQNESYPPYQGEMKILPEEIESIIIIQGNSKTSRVMTIANNKFSAKFSLPYSISVFLKYGRLDLECFNDNLVKNKEIIDLQKKVHFKYCKEMLENPKSCKIKINLKNGKILEGECIDVYGRPKRKARKIDIKNKFDYLLKEIFSKHYIELLWYNIKELENIESVEELFNINKIS